MKKINISPAIEGIIFDCDGTLADTMPLHWEAWHETLEFFDAKCPQDFLEDLKGVPTKTIVEKINKSFGYALDPNLFSEEKERRLLSKLYRVKSIQPVEDLARQYKDILPMAVASGSLRNSVLETLKGIQMNDFFDTVITANDALSPKPDPAVFLEAAKRIQVKPENCLVLEDSDAGIEAAKKAGMHFIDVRPILT
ncbi:MAG: HAD family hydrolase [Chloroflexi bacterium]|nr:MAG: HAD family hydrolase [Chloroflexota bacterium]